MFEIMARGTKIYTRRSKLITRKYGFLNIVCGRYRKEFKRNFARNAYAVRTICVALAILAGLCPTARQYRALLSRISLRVARIFAMSDKSDPIGMSRSPCRSLRIAIPLL